MFMKAVADPLHAGALRGGCSALPHPTLEWFKSLCASVSLLQGEIPELEVALV